MQINHLTQTTQLPNFPIYEISHTKLNQNCTAICPNLTGNQIDAIQTMINAQSSAIQNTKTLNPLTSISSKYLPQILNCLQEISQPKVFMKKSLQTGSCLYYDMIRLQELFNGYFHSLKIGYETLFNLTAKEMESKWGSQMGRFNQSSIKAQNKLSLLKKEVTVLKTPIEEKHSTYLPLLIGTVLGSVSTAVVTVVSLLLCTKRKKRVSKTKLSKDPLGTYTPIYRNRSGSVDSQTKKPPLTNVPSLPLSPNTESLLSNMTTVNTLAVESSV